MHDKVMAQVNGICLCFRIMLNSNEEFDLPATPPPI